MPRIAFFGTPQIAVWVLEALEQAGFLPALIITNPDAPQGRKMLLTPPPVKVWAKERDIPVMQPETLRDPAFVDLLKKTEIDLSIVVAYGKIIPKEVLEIPAHGTLNVHPSLLPALRGASPIRSTILGDTRETGVTIMLMDEEMDHGPIVAQETTPIDAAEWPLPGRVLDERMARHGGTLLAATIPLWLSGSQRAREQDHEKATFCTKITKSMGELDLSADPRANLLKIRAFDGWPGTFFFHERDGTRTRVKVVDAHIENGALVITRIVPEGKNEMDYSTFIRN